MKKDFIFVTDDSKEDWVLELSGRTIGPRPELLDEFARETGRRILIFNTEGFLLAAKSVGSMQVSDSVIKEVSEYLVPATPSEAWRTAHSLKKMSSKNLIDSAFAHAILKEGDNRLSSLTGAVIQRLMNDHLRPYESDEDDAGKKKFAPSDLGDDGKIDGGSSED